MPRVAEDVCCLKQTEDDNEEKCKEHDFFSFLTETIQKSGAVAALHKAITDRKLELNDASFRNVGIRLIKWIISAKMRLFVHRMFSQTFFFE